MVDDYRPATKTQTNGRLLHTPPRIPPSIPGSGLASGLASGIATGPAADSATKSVSVTTKTAICRNFIFD